MSDAWPTPEDIARQRWERDRREAKREWMDWPEWEGLDDADRDQMIAEAAEDQARARAILDEEEDE